MPKTKFRNARPPVSKSLSLSLSRSAGGVFGGTPHSFMQSHSPCASRSPIYTHHAFLPPPHTPNTVDTKEAIHLP